MHSNIRVVHLLNELKPSGAEAMLRCAAPMWRDQHIECDLLSTGATPGPYADTLEQAGYRILHLPNTRNTSFLHQLWRLLRSERYDIAHQHAEQMSFWTGAVARATGSQVVRTVHNNFVFNGSLRLRRALQRRLLSLVGVRFVTIGASVFANEMERFGNRTTVVRNWADFSRSRIPSTEDRTYARSHWGFADQDFVVLSLGNCSTVKNHEAILRAVAMLPNGNRVRYLHLGIEDKGREERALARDLGIVERVIFAGWLEDPSLALFAADAFVMPSLYEGFSIAALEALAAGLPAILSERPGLIDLRSHFQGIAFTDTTGESVANALNCCMNRGRNSRQAFASQNREVALQEFSAERGVREYSALYRTLVARRHLHGIA